VEVTAEAIKVLRAIERRWPGLSFAAEVLPAGARAFLEGGSDMPPETWAACRAADAIFLGAMGLPDVRRADGTEIAPQPLPASESALGDPEELTEALLRQTVLFLQSALAFYQSLPSGVSPVPLPWGPMVEGRRQRRSQRLPSRCSALSRTLTILVMVPVSAVTFAFSIRLSVSGRIPARRATSACDNPTAQRRRISFRARPTRKALTAG
jgi:hypothetical protein